MTDGIIKIGLPAAGPAFAGEEWDDGNRSEIAQIFIWHGDEKLHAIQTQYLENGTLVMSELHGTATDATNFTVVKFDIGKEYITGIHSQHSQGSVTSLTISTNFGNRGTFGVQGTKDSNCSCNPSAYYPPTHPGYGSSSSNLGAAYVRHYNPVKEFKVDLGRYGGGQFRGFCGTANRSDLTSIGICFKVATSINDLKPGANT